MDTKVFGWLKFGFSKLREKNEENSNGNEKGRQIFLSL